MDSVWIADEDDVDDSKKYTAFSIPPREARPRKDGGSPIRTSAPSAPLFTNTDFAEIEMDVPAAGNHAAQAGQSVNPSAVPAQPVGPRTVDPIRETFYAMRSLASDNPLARNDAGLFYKQAKFMEDFSDEFYGFARFSMYYPYYQHMGYEQLRTYFTWRTNARRGHVSPTSLSYIFLYIYELLSQIGVTSPADGLYKLLAVWTACREKEPSLDQYLPAWLKDYHIYYELPHRFADFANQHHLRNYYPPELFLFDAAPEDALAAWNGLSSYDVTKSKFYTGGHDERMRDCFAAVLRSMDELCAGHKCRVEELLIYGLSKAAVWFPFQRALFTHWLRQPDRQVEMPGREFYRCAENRWTANLPIYYSSRRELAGYFIKKTEACLRRAVKYRFHITADPAAAGQAFGKMKSLGISPAALDGVIEKSVADFHKNSTRTVVTVNHDNLARIRKEALGTQDKLTVPEDAVLPRGAVIFTTQRTTESFDCTRASLAKDTSNTTKSLCDSLCLCGENNSSTDGWAALKAALSETERAALSLALRGGMDIKAFADEHGVMLEVLADGINEKATDFIGDNILTVDEAIAIYDDYRENIAEIVG